MTRILLIETASPKRISEKAGQIFRSGIYPNPEIVILCAEGNASSYRELRGVQVCALPAHSGNRVIAELAQANFDVAFAFWTGERRYRGWKLLGIRLKAKEKYILSGDGNEFRLTWKACIRHAAFRFRHPLPTDHLEYALQEGLEKVLLIQSAEPSYVIRALARLQEKPLFTNPQFSIFCRNKPEIARSFEGNPMLSQIITHCESRNSWTHLRSLRTQRFDAIVLFLTGDRSYWKVKLFAFLLGTRRILIFNEAIDCFFFNFHQWLALIAHRVRVRPDPGWNSQWSRSARILVSLVLKSVILPFRFLWLLFVWTRLRAAGWRLSREQ